jgi:hypothetical protein
MKLKIIEIDGYSIELRRRVGEGVSIRIIEEGNVIYGTLLSDDALEVDILELVIEVIKDFQVENKATIDNDMVEVYVNGEWDCSFETSPTIVIWDKGEVHTIDKKDYGDFLDALDYDCYLCLDLFKHPKWNGTIITYS